MADILKVDTQQLKSTASAVRGQIRRMQQDFDGLQNIVSRSSYYWQGQAADEYRQAFAEQKDPTAGKDGWRVRGGRGEQRGHGWQPADRLHLRGGPG